MSKDREHQDRDEEDVPLRVVGSSPEELLGMAENQAHSAGVRLLEWFHHGFNDDDDDSPEVATKSSPTDLVGRADIEVERRIREVIELDRPQDGFIGEESGERAGTSGLTWVVDPLDGTVNFLFGIPQWCVSIAVRDGDGVLVGAIFDPLRNELFTATRDGPAVLTTPEKPRLFWPEPHYSSYDRLTLLGKECLDLSKAMVATGFAYDAQVRAAQAEVLTGLLPRVRDIRRSGSAALDLAWTAAGRYDAYFERTVKPWDIAAGVLVCQKAGLEVRELAEREGLTWGVLVSTPQLVEPLLELVG
ncbi:MAG: inositol monophosphatase family protein [Solirubrobacteraceae bacterium]